MPFLGPDPRPTEPGTMVDGHISMVLKGSSWSDAGATETEKPGTELKLQCWECNKQEEKPTVGT